MRQRSDPRPDDFAASAAPAGDAAPVTLDLGPLRDQCQAAAGLLKLLANPDRLLILCFLSEGEACVGRVEESTGIGQPTLSQQLTVLRENGLIQSRRDGKFIHYRVADASVHVLLRTLHGLFCRAPQTRRQITPKITPSPAVRPQANAER